MVRDSPSSGSNWYSEVWVGRRWVFLTLAYYDAVSSVFEAVICMEVLGLRRILPYDHLGSTTKLQTRVVLASGRYVNLSCILGSGSAPFVQVMLSEI